MGLFLVGDVEHIGGSKNTLANISHSFGMLAPAHPKTGERRGLNGVLQDLLEQEGGKATVLMVFHKRGMSTAQPREGRQGTTAHQHDLPGGGRRASGLHDKGRRRLLFKG